MSDDRINDATVFGTLDPELTSRQINIALGSRRDHPQDKWVNNPMTISDLIVMLSKHKEGPKDGPCFLQAELVGGMRRGPSVRAMHILDIDLDTGEDPDEVLARIEKFGLFCIAYSTHSHMKPVSEIDKSRLVNYCGGEREPTLADAVGYLRNVMNYRPYILEGAELLPSVHTDRGVMIFVKHQPMPKFRLVFVLDKPFVIADRHLDPKRSIIEWKNRYAGVSIALGVHFDKSCVDPTRLFYLPRHSKGSPEAFIAILAGKALKIEDYDEITLEELKKRNMDPFAAEEATIGKTYKTANLMKFVAKYGSRFQVRDFIADRGLKSLGTSNGGETFNPCPYDADHSNPGDEADMGFWVVSADGDKPFVMSCKHSHCADRDRVDFLDGLCCSEINPIVDAKELLQWVEQEDGEPDDFGWDDAKPGSEKEERQNVTKAAKGYLTRDQAEKDLAACSPDDNHTIIGIMRKIGAGDFNELTRSDLVNKAAKQFKKEKVVLKKAMQEGQRDKQRIISKVSTLTPDAEKELVAFNEQYALVRVGSEMKFMLIPEQQGEVPAFFNEASFRIKTANQKTIGFDAEGKPKEVPLSKTWVEWEGRREYHEVVFEPELSEEDCIERNVYNVWRGFPIKGHGTDADWDLMHRHIYDNICQKNHDHYVWLMTWIAQIFQQPGIKLGSAVAIRGKKGVGKSTLFYWVAKALGHHAIKVSQREHITGKFNAHLTSALLMVCEEAFWAGDNAAGGVLKDLITSDQTMVERKGVDTVQMSNYVRLAMLSNEDWVVPAGLDDERRYFVLECGNEKQGDRDYFDAITEQMESGGLEAMIQAFTVWDPTTWDIDCYGDQQQMSWSLLRKPPRTPWLTSQGVESLTSPERFFMTAAMFGYIGSVSQNGEINPTPLIPDRRQHISLEELEFHYDNALKNGYGGRQYAGNRVHMLKLAQKWLLADEATVTQKGDEGWQQYVILGTLNDIRAALAARGIMARDYRVVQNLATMDSADTVDTVKTFSRKTFA